MDTFPLNLKSKEILDLMRDFYTLTGIRIVIFDSEFCELLSWPEQHCPFCARMQANEATRKKCIKSNEESFRRCQKSEELAVFYCHAGLVEATAPLIDHGTIIGYVMFGQISDLESKEQLVNHIDAVLTKYGLASEEDSADLYRVSRKTQQQILAAARILDACTSYVIQKEMIRLQNQTFRQNLNQFITSHLSENLSIDRLAREFRISRSRLYALTGDYRSGGIAAYIRKLRVDEAKRLLRTTDLGIGDISSRVGFADYNYFQRVFKAQTGMPARAYRKLYRRA